jgi:aryl-alcohol dehydrogenase-like predicted oxidoreductase
VVTNKISAAAGGTFNIGDDIPVHRVGFGAMRLTGPGIWGPPEDRAEAMATLRRCLELGVNLIDTAESYGPYVSEELIADALHPYPHDLVIATKGGLDRPGPHQWQANGHPARLRDALEGSLRRLRLERIDLYQLHRIDPEIPEEEQLGFLQWAQREGMIRHIGLSEVGVQQIQRARRFFRVASVQNKYNLVDREWEPVVEYCEREQIAFLPWYPLQAGKVGETGGPVTAIAQRHGATPAQIALAWLLRRSPVMLPIPGTSRRQHLEENVAAANIMLSQPECDALF